MSDLAILYLVIIFVLLLFSGFFSGSDMAFSCVNERKLREAMNKGSKAASLATTS